jgi:hypothetical protein
VVEGEAGQVMDESVLERLAETWATKWDGRWHYEVHDRGFRHAGGTGAVLVFSGEARKGARVRQRYLRPDAPPVLRTSAPHLTCGCLLAFCEAL